jgi:hypothetical protein
LNDPSSFSQLQRLQALRESGAISDGEFLLLQAALRNGAMKRAGTHSTPLLLDHPPAYLIVLGVSFLFLLCLGIASGPIFATQPPKNTSEKFRRTYSIGEPMQRDSLIVTVDSVQTGRVIGSVFFNHKAPEGAVLVAIGYSIKNTSSVPVSIFGRPRLQLIDGSGVRYDPDVGASMALAVTNNSEGKVLSKLNPGITIRENTAFEVSSSDFNKSTWMIILDGDDTMPVKLN